MKTSHLIIYILFAFTATIVLLNRYTDLYISNYRIHFLFLFCAAASFVIISGHLFEKLRSNKSMIIATIIVGIVCFAKAFFTWGGDWKTQVIVYQNIESPNKTIDYQMRADRFSFGYKERIVEIRKLVPYIEWTTDVDTLHMENSKWKRIDLPLNNGLPKTH